MRTADSYRGHPNYIRAKLPSRYEPAGLKQKRIWRFGVMEYRPLTYSPNGDRECWRRRRQMLRQKAA